MQQATLRPFLPEQSRSGLLADEKLGMRQKGRYRLDLGEDLRCAFVREST